MNIAIDVGGSHFDVAQVDETRVNIIFSSSLNENSSFRDFIESLLNTLVAKGIRNISKLCFALPGIVDPFRNFCFKCPNLIKWRNLDFSSIYDVALKKGIQVEKILVGNDANCGAVGAFKSYNLSKEKNIVYLVIGTGIGSGAIINGKLIIGSNFLGMEIGHTKIDKNSYVCGCGSKSCIETFSSAKYLTIYYNQKFKTNHLALVDIVNSGHKVDFIFKRFSHYLALLVNNIIYLFDPDYVFITGKIVLSLKFFEKLFFKKLSSLVRMIDNYDFRRIVFLKDVQDYNAYNLIGSVYLDEFI